MFAPLMLDVVDALLEHVSSFLWSYILLFGLLGTHLYLTLILRFPQRHLLTALRYYFKGNRGAAGHISQFSSLMIALAANVGTGNIIGVAVAVTAGGPGAVFWCMMTGFLGMASRYAESLLAIRYRVRDTRGQIVGGPMYVLEQGLGCKWLGVVFAALTALAAFGIGNVTQAHAVAGVLEVSALHVPPWGTGLALFLLVAAVLLGGLKGISRFCSACVPTMAIVYLVGCLLLLLGNAEYVLPAVKLIVKSAFCPQAAMGGAIGSSVIIAMQTGVRRGLFSNEAGMGSSPIISAPARTPNPVQQAVVASSGPFWDTVVICTMTGLALTTALLAHPELGVKDGEVLTYHCFGSMGSIGSLLLTVSLTTFVVSTLLGWSYFGERALEYLGGKRLIVPYRIVWVIATFVACVIPRSSLVWNFADIANGLMALPNLFCMIALSGTLISETRYYLWQNRLDKEDTRAIPRWDDKKRHKAGE